MCKIGRFFLIQRLCKLTVFSFIGKGRKSPIKCCQSWRFEPNFMPAEKNKIKLPS